jgi:hypothetical protein
MILEQVLPHQYRDDIYIDQVITPHEKVSTTDKIIVNRMLLREIAISQ